MKRWCVVRCPPIRIAGMFREVVGRNISFD
nr:MAG TPA: hypothetical protein [Caudoviricetes sp.]